MIDDGAADGEVVEALKCGALQAQHFMHRVVEKAADAGAAHPGGLCFQIQNLAAKRRRHRRCIRSGLFPGSSDMGIVPFVFFRTSAES
jgi:hypothetical protein